MRRSLSSCVSSIESQLNDLEENVEKLLEEKTRELAMVEKKRRDTEERFRQLIQGVETFLNDSKSPLSGPCLQLKDTLQRIVNEGSMKTSLLTARPQVRKLETKALKNKSVNRDYASPPSMSRVYLNASTNRDYRTPSAMNGDYSNPPMMNRDYRTSSAMNGDFPSPSPYSLFPTSGEPPVYNQTLNIFNQMPFPPQAPPAPPAPVTMPVYQPLLYLPYYPFSFPPADMSNLTSDILYGTPNNLVGEEAIDVVSIPNYNDDDDVTREETVYTEQSVSMDYGIPTLSLSSQIAEEEGEATEQRKE